jgi:hypothetical protein
MKLWKIWQDVNTGYDTFDSAVVIADDAEKARLIHPNGSSWDGDAYRWWSGIRSEDMSWCHPSDVKVLLIGETSIAKPGVVVSSFNAG